MSAADHFRPTDHGRHDHITADRPQTICPHGSHVNQITEPKGDFGCVSRALRSLKGGNWFPLVKINQLGRKYSKHPQPLLLRHNITGTGCGSKFALDHARYDGNYSGQDPADIDEDFVGTHWSQQPHPGTAVDGPATTVNGPTAVMPAADIVAPVPSVEVMDSTDFALNQ
ncbi:hypothetical protein GGX14DRAFT_623036 [Mycena pura]|uniref:Uncharacterized protein n=1 Tax=Mycena pura TaxID=153505 RepID=A0AAD6VGR7_9AGAR|nr:hypothetical protein GGX14DRAFT_623036 [Mycena pura]